ncbi:hypothetical protein H4R24_003857 [Coemansia sp. RSA 988]|nr:hypothetical protein H4R24_003857 [Coemansia sp. RSA 988]
MSDGTPGGRSGSGNLGAQASPLRIFTRIGGGTSNSSAGEHTPDDVFTPREAASTMLGSSFGQSYEDRTMGSSSRPSSSHKAHGENSHTAASRAAKAAARIGRQGGHYHALPSHWRGHDSSPSSIGSPVTPDSGGQEDANALRLLPLVNSAGSQVACTPEPFRPFHNSRDYRPTRTKAGRGGQSPAASPHIQVGTLSGAFGSASSLDWVNDRPDSKQSHTSADPQADSPLDQTTHGGHFLPTLGALAARSNAQRAALGGTKHHQSPSTSSSHYSYSMNSPPIRPPGSTAFAFGGRDPTTTTSLPATTVVSPSLGVTGDSAPPQGEDIVRKYFGIQRQSSGVAADTITSGTTTLQQQQPQSSNQQLLSVKGSVDIGDDNNTATSSIVYRRAVSSGDLPALDELHEALQSSAMDSRSSSKNILTYDFVESPLEALVRRLTIELFQLYVSEDRRRLGSSTKGPRLSALGHGSMSNEDEDIAQSLSRVLDPLTTDEGYVQQFRLGPSIRSGSTTPAVTMDGYFVPHQTGSGAAETAGEGDDVRPRPRPRHRLLERTWMEEALIKARRVSTIDETAGEAILQELDLEAGSGSPTQDPSTLRSMAANVVDSLKIGSLGPSSPQAVNDVAQFGSSTGTGQARMARRGQVLPRGVAGEARGMPQLQRGDSGERRRVAALGLASVSEEGGDSTDDGTGRGVSPRGYHRARDPAARHRKQAAGISPARASLLRAVGRRQSVRLQPGKGQIVVSDTPTGSRTDEAAGNRNSLAAPVTLDAESLARAKRTNSLPGAIQVPETREVSYQELQRKAARSVEVTRAAKSRARVVRRAERMVRGGTQPATARKRHGQHRRAASRAADMELQLVCVELPPPVPLRVRREQVRAAPEPLIVVRRAVTRPRHTPAATAQQRIGRVQNQLLGAQAVLSRHNSAVRQQTALKANDGASRAPGSGTVRKQALDVMMLESALDDRIDADERQRLVSVKQQRRRMPRDADADSQGDGESASRPWRNARRRSTLRRKQEASQARQQGALEESQQQHQSESQQKSRQTSTHEPVSIPKPPPPSARRLLLHGPAYKMTSVLRARPDTYLFLFTDLLVVTIRAGAAQLYAGADALKIVPMAAPSPDAATIPANDRYRVLIVAPLAQKTTMLRREREGASKRGGEDVEAEERRVEAQEERVRRACHTFEKNASEAVVYLINHEIIGPTADTVAGFLHRCTALNRRQTGSFLGAGIVGENLHHNPTADEVEQEKSFHQLAWTTFVDHCSIVAVSIDEALRSILLYCRLPTNRRSTGILLELAALQWFTKNREHGPTPGVFVPESQDIAVKLAFTVMMLNSEVHNPMVRSSDAHDAVYHTFVNKFRASVVDDPALAAKRKGNVLRKRDQPRVVTVMEVPSDVLRAIYDRILANRLVTCSDTYATAPEFDIDWVRSPEATAAPLSDEQVAQDVEDIYSDPGFRDGILFNASSDRLPAKYNVDPPAWVRVTVRIPDPDPNFVLTVRVVGASSDAPTDALAILPASRLEFSTTNSACFVIRPRYVGHFTLHFVPEGSRARYYHPIPPRKIVVEGAFMRNVLQLSWKRSDPHASHGRHLFGLDSPVSKSRWVHALDAAMRASAGASAKDVLRRAECAAQSLAALTPVEQSKSDAASVGTVARSSVDQGITPMQLLGSLSPE